MSIETDWTGAVNRYAPTECAKINLYSTELASGLTLGQLTIAVCIRSAAAYENQSVLKMNTMTSGSVLLEDAAYWLQKIADGSANWTSARDFLMNRLGISSNELPDNLDTFDKRMQAASALKNKMDTLAQSQQEDMIDLQTLVNRRDVAYSTSSNVVRTLGTSMSGNAQNFLG
ncbi:MAG: hypothetical protein IKR48_05485 [Kiritimatiellae bacterium]|nr:hypothetical protein [Kiritimatiellia bacterium]